MYLCYLDESGVPEIPGNSTHFVLAGIAIPIERWREADAAISEIMARYGLAGEELHTAWLLRKYLEQSKVDGFGEMGWDERRAQVARLRVAEIHRVRKLGIAKRNAQLKKVYRHTDPYIHLTFDERNRLALEIAETISKWDWAVLIASCIHKSYSLISKQASQVNEAAFSAVLVKFVRHLENVERLSTLSNGALDRNSHVCEYGLVIHDNNPTVVLKHTRQFQNRRENQRIAGFDLFDRIIETPLFVDSSLTRMIQLADLWGYSLRRYVENGETNLFSILFQNKSVETAEASFPLPRIRIEHMVEKPCPCLICDLNNNLFGKVI
jgi:hypothetical protein